MNKLKLIVIEKRIKRKVFGTFTTFQSFCVLENIQNWMFFKEDS